jgi:hypothetical protein
MIRVGEAEIQYKYIKKGESKIKSNFRDRILDAAYPCGTVFLFFIDKEGIFGVLGISKRRKLPAASNYNERESGCLEEQKDHVVMIITWTSCTTAAWR